jgi:hypothetical protein
MATVILKDVRIAFPDLFQARQFEGQGPFTYGATFLMDPNSEAANLVRKTIQEVATAQWQKKADDVLKAIAGNNQKICFYPGDNKEYDGFAGMMALSSKRQQEAGHPKIVDQKLNELSSADGKPYGGSYVNAKVDIWAQENKWGKGIRCTLIAVQFVKDGDAFTAAPPATTEGFGEEESTDDGGLI